MGDITRKNKDVSPDPVLLKSDGYPTYHLANVIDDHLMGITHIMRAQEWIPSGPLHILLYEAFGWQPPVYCHLPMVCGKDGQKLSKRHGDTAVRDFRKKGYLPEAILNYVTLVGWSLDGSREFFTRQELEQCFVLENIHVSSGTFDYKKLDWFNGQYIRQKSDEEIVSLILPYLQEAGFISNEVSAEERKTLMLLAPPLKERMKILSDAVPLSAFLFKDEPVTDKAQYIAKGMDEDKTREAFRKGSEIILSNAEAGKPFSQSEDEIKAYAESEGIKVNGVFQPVRVALTNSTVSLPLHDTVALLGVQESRRRIERAMRLFDQE